MSIGDPSTARERATQASRPTLPVAVVMTAHSGAPFLKEALDGIREQTAPAAEVIVVDNASGLPVDELLRRHPATRRVVAGANVGFAAGCRLGAEAARAPALAEPTRRLYCSRPAISATSMTKR